MIFHGMKIVAQAQHNVVLIRWIELVKLGRDVKWNKHVLICDVQRYHIRSF